MPKGFEKLRKKVEREYEAKGVPEATARAYGYGTAEKVYKEQQAKKGCLNCRLGISHNH